MTPCPKCKKNEAAEPHFCPYDEDVNNDAPENWKKCTCCDECARECGDDI